MKRLGLITPRRLTVVLVLIFGAIAIAANGGELQSARVTQIINDVRLLPHQAAARPAVVNDSINGGTAVRTGSDSRTELTFADLTITRLGANTIFGFNTGARQVDLSAGAVLVEVPRNGAEVKIRTAAVTAAVSGGTALFESHHGLPTKLLILEGIARFYPNGHPELAEIVRAGEMAMMTVGGRMTRPTKFNAALVYKTSKLITSFPPLPNADLIMAVIAEQQTAIAAETSAPASDNSIDKRDLASTASAPSTTSTGGKFGPPALIVDDPYHVTSGTVINTDPMITTGGITNFGKIYRSAAMDGPLATWVGSSPIPFDKEDFVNSSGGGFNAPDTVPIAGFLFNSLSLDGDPTISNAGGIPTLGLAARNDITASPSGTVFSFGGMQDVGLISLNGSITLSGLSLANFGELFAYARGGNLTVESPMSNLDKVTLRALDTIELHSPLAVNQSFKALAGNTFETTSMSTANQITIQSLGSINIASSSQLLAMLNSVGNSGQVLIIASGGTGVANVGGTVQANQGEIDIRQTGTAGQTTIDSATIHGDIVKISALGANGVLNIGTANLLNADTILKLYATGSNGTINFLSNVTLSSPTSIIAANTITISPGVQVTINSVNQAQIFTNVPNYNFMPSPSYNGPPPNAANGTFTGSGAKDPQPLANAPPLGAPGHGM
jgi:FecR protein